jgi:hypothetical protein
MILPIQRGIPPLNLPMTVVSAIVSLTARQTISVCERRRLNILLDLKSLCQQHVADKRGHVRRTVRRWLERGRLMLEKLAGRAEPFSCGELKHLLLTTVADAYRSGCQTTYTPEQQCALISLAVQKPSEFGLPVENWTHWELAEVINTLSLAPGISRQTVTRILWECDLKPHRSKYRENPTLVDQKEFDRTVKEIRAIYGKAPEALQKNIRVVSLDEKTGIQALESRRYRFLIS